MMKLIIADDEKWVRATVKALIPFERLDLVLSCEAANGIEALELCRRHEPDILLTDIMMPGLSGLELIKELRTLQPNLRIVIISGYSDFEYAKTAMKYGITDYLLKPVDENELFQVLDRIRTELYEQARLIREEEAEKEQYKKALPVMYEAFLNQLISHNHMTTDQIRNEFQKYGLNMTGNTYTLCIFAPDDSSLSNEGRMENAYRQQLIRRAMKHFTKAITFPLTADKHVLVSLLNNSQAEKIQKAFRLCNRILEKRSTSTVSAGISGSSPQLCMLPTLFGNARTALDTRFWSGKGSIAAYEQGSLSGDLKLVLTEEMLNKIALNLKLSNVQTALSYVEATISSFKQNCNISPTLVKEFFWQFVQSIIILLNIQLPFIQREFLVAGEKPYERIMKTQFIDSLESCVKELIENIYSFYHDKNPMDHNNLIENAKKVIESNFSGDINLEQVAKYVHISPAYLSELFKKETGMSFIDYKTIIRIENAKKLLCTPSLNIAEISGKVGYSDPKYFSKLFKKITGRTIHEYRKEIREIH